MLETSGLYDFDVVDFDTAVTDDGAIEFWADVYDRVREHTVIVTGRWDRAHAAFERVWLDEAELGPQHPLRRTIESDNYIARECGRAADHAAQSALEAARW